MRRFLTVILILFFSSSIEISFAHVGSLPSVHDTVANILERFRQELNPEQVRNLNRQKALELLQPEERKVLSSGFLTFHLNKPATIFIACSPGDRAPFWLTDQGFTHSALTLTTPHDGAYEIWQKEVAAGDVGLGVNSIDGGGKHYLVFIKPRAKKAVEIKNVYPGQHKVVPARQGERYYADDDGILETLPPELTGAMMIQTLRANRDVAKLTGELVVTRFPSTPQPDQIVLSWEGDPRTTQTITWRTDTTITDAFVMYQLKEDYTFFHRKEPAKTKASTMKLKTDDLVNDRSVNRHSITLQGLRPNSTYIYSVGDTSNNRWSEISEFNTAPDRVIPFSFMYLGDAQNGLDRWGTLMQNAYRQRPDMAFVLMAGDLVNRGAKRDDWDDLFYNGAVVFSKKPLMPTIGNHECQGGHPTLYLKLFHLPTNGPQSLEPERAYSFEYSNALFVIMDSNEDAQKQAPWLDAQLTNSKSTWKFVMFHHPIYSSAKGRDNSKIHDAWLPIFDKHHVDMVLQGHDHAYLRTYPMRQDQRAASAKEGTIYVVAVSGTKMYEQGTFDYTEKGFTNTSTFQILDVQISGDRLLYRSYDLDGKPVDEFEIKK